MSDWTWVRWMDNKIDSSTFLERATRAGSDHPLHVGAAEIAGHTVLRMA